MLKLQSLKVYGIQARWSQSDGRLCLAVKCPGWVASPQALLRYDGERKEVVLVSDRDYQVGDPILAWCGPQPNSRVRGAA